MSPNIKHDTTEKSAPLSDIFAANTQFNHSPVLRGHVTIARQMRALSLGHVTLARPMRIFFESAATVISLFNRIPG